MALIFISAIFMAFSLQFFTLNYQIQGLNKEMLNTPIQLLANCFIDYSNKPYFDTELVISTMDAYYADRIPRYAKSYSIDYYFYTPSNGAYCTATQCGGVKITLTCSLITNYQFTRSMKYEMRSGIYG